MAARLFLEHVTSGAAVYTETIVRASKTFVEYITKLVHRQCKYIVTIYFTGI